MEEIDRKILRLMVNDGRMSYTDLGKATGLSTSAAHQRVRRLEQRGVIKGYRAVVDEDALGLPLTAFISVKPFDPAAPDDVPARLAGLSEIESCHSVAGEENYILKVRVASPGSLEGLLARIRSAANVSTRTTIVLSTPFEGRAAEAPAELVHAAETRGEVPVGLTAELPVELPVELTAEAGVEAAYEQL